MIHLTEHLLRGMEEMEFNTTIEPTWLHDGPSEAMSLDDSGNESSGFTSFHPAIFWGLNVIFIAICCGLCCYYNRVAEDSEDDNWWTRLSNPAVRRQQADAEFQATLRAREERRQQAGRMHPAKRQRLLLSSFRRNQVYMTIREEDLVLEEQSPSVDIESSGSFDSNKVDQDHDDNASIHGYLKLSNGNSVPNCCAICLGDYQVGDQVVWSINYQDKCPHAFHQDCMLDWLVKMQPYTSTPCPCCRQEFTDWEEICKLRKIKWSSDQAFDPQRIRWR